MHGTMKWIINCFTIVALAGCSSTHIITVWKAQPVHNTAFNQVLVAVVVPQEDSALRRQLENELVIDLNSLGYPAIASLDYFGSAGTAGMSEEKTYTKLCSSGIDFVLIAALIPRTKEIQYHSDHSLLYPAVYYYERIVGYKNISAIEDSLYLHQYYESILFDLASLRPLSVFRTRTFDKSQRANTSGFAKNLTQKMLREKILKKQPSNKGLKPF
jgi:hypothetical protein